ncbi:MAG TPA: hypothetical protein VFM45_00805, partial [Anaeromyxobacteraceae bacterium]|nr:hypothetical protein [Anaeromyxobacteraceae bacterium]
MRRLEVADLSLAVLDALDVEALAVLVGPERPLQGLAGLVDWRLCGALTRALRGGLYAGAPGEALLLLAGPERPLQGLAGLVDWRTCGALTRALRGGLWAGAPGEALLLPAAPRLPGARVLVVGFPGEAGPEGWRAALSAGLAAAVRAGAAALATSLPPPPGGDAALGARLALEAAGGLEGRLVLLGEARALLAELGRAAAGLGRPVEVAAFSA